MTQRESEYYWPEFKYTPKATIAKFIDSRTKYYEAMFYEQSNPKSAIAKKRKADALEKLNALGTIARNQSKTREGYLPKSPSPSSLPRSSAGVKTTTKTVNKLYRPMGK